MRRYLGFIITALFFFILIDGALPQAQIAIFSGRVLIQNIILKLLLTICLSMGFLAFTYKTGSIIWHKILSLPYLLFITYLTIHLLLFRGNYSLDYLLFSYNAYYYFILIIPFASYILLTSGYFNRWLLVSSIPLLAIGYSQYWLKAALLPLKSDEGYFQVISWEYYDRIRAFSLFSSGLAYGHFLALLGALIMIFMVRSRHVYRMAAILFFAIVVFACYTTFTRNIYIEFVFTVFTAFVLTRNADARMGPSGITGKLLVFMPVIYGIAAAAVVYAGQLYLLTTTRDSLVVKDDSLKMRLLEWAYYFPLWTRNGLQQLLFGTGLIQGSRISVDDAFVPDIDNSFLAVGVHIGLIGLLLWMFFMWETWKWLLHFVRKDPDNSAVLAIAAFWSTWVSSGLFNSTLSLYPMLAMMVLPLYSTARSRANRDRGANAVAS